MATELKIKVTKEIFERSKMCGTGIGTSFSSSKNCAIALAVRDIFPKADVGVTAIFTEGLAISDETPCKISLPEEASDFIRKFDNLRHFPNKRCEMDEIEFSIQIPNYIVEKIDISSLTKILEGHPTLELVK